MFGGRASEVVLAWDDAKPRGRGSTAGIGRQIAGNMASMATRPKRWHVMDDNGHVPYLKYGILLTSLWKQQYVRQACS